MGSGRRLALLVHHSFGRNISSHPLQEQQQQQKPSAEFASFEADLTARTQQLQLQGGGGSAHLNWLLDACACTLSTHSSLASLLHSSASSPSPAAADIDARSHLLSQRADQMLSLLDVCTSLKQMADDADRQLGRLQQALHSAGKALRAPHFSAAKVQAAAHRLRTACQLATSMRGKQLHRDQANTGLLLAAKRVEAVPTASGPLEHALDSTLVISLLLLASTLSSFTAPTTGATRTICKLVARYCSKSSSGNPKAAATWVAPLRQLQHDLRHEEMGAMFVELQALYASVASLVTVLESNAEVARQGVDSLQKRSQEARMCLSTLRSHLASLFQALLMLRLSLLH